MVNPIGAADKKENGVVLPEKRWYLDLSRHVNAHLPHYLMQLPGYDAALDRLTQGCYMAKVDLSAAFLHVRIDRHSRRLLGFQWNGKFYQFSRMIYGLTMAPAVWQYVTERICNFFRSLGLCVIVYLDDFLLIADSKELCQSSLDRMLAEFAELGVIVNHKKTILPAQVCRFLGLDIDSVRMQILVPDYKLARIKKELTDFRAHYSASSSTPLRDLLALVGRLSHVSRAVRSSRTFLRRMWDCTGSFAHHSRPTTHVTLEKAFWADFEWWETFMFRWNGVARWTSKSNTIVFSDACLTGFGFHSGLEFRFGSWPIHFHREHINWLELRALEMAAWHFAAVWPGLRILFACDNQAVVDIINSGTSRNPRQADIMRRLALLGAVFDFQFRAVHIPGAKNVWADCLSRLVCDKLSTLWLEPDFILSLPSLSTLSSLETREKCIALANANSFSSLGASHIPSEPARKIYDQLLRQVHSLIPSLEQSVRLLERTDPSGAHRCDLPQVPSVLRINSALQPASASEHRSPSKLRHSLPTQTPFRLDRQHGLPRAHEWHPADHLSPLDTQAPIPLKVVTSTHPSCSQVTLPQAAWYHYAHLPARYRILRSTTEK